MALNLHGFERMTADFDLLMTPMVSPESEPRLSDSAMLRHSRAQRRFKATATGVPVDIASGEYPGDAKPKPVEIGAILTLLVLIVDSAMSE